MTVIVFIGSGATGVAIIPAPARRAFRQERTERDGAMPAPDPDRRSETVAALPAHLGSQQPGTPPGVATSRNHNARVTAHFAAPVRLSAHQDGVMSAQEIDKYLDGLEEPKRTTLARLRQMILDVLPEAGQGISCGVPAFIVGGKTIAGFAAFTNYLSYLPLSGSAFPPARR
jgi:hypothetical protein